MEKGHFSNFTNMPVTFLSHWVICEDDTVQTYIMDYRPLKVIKSTESGNRNLSAALKVRKNNFLTLQFNCKTFRDCVCQRLLSVFHGAWLYPSIFMLLIHKLPQLQWQTGLSDLIMSLHWYKVEISDKWRFPGLHICCPLHKNSPPLLSAPLFPSILLTLRFLPK